MTESPHHLSEYRDQSRLTGSGQRTFEKHIPTPDVVPATMGALSHMRTPGPPGAFRGALIGLQQTAGNSAVQRLLAQTASSPVLPTTNVDSPSILRNPDPQTTLKEPATGVVVEPGKLKTGQFNSPVPLPSSLRMRKPPGSGQGAALTAPSFELRIDPTMLVAGILDGVDLGGFTLVNPTVVFNPRSNTLTGEATLSIPSSVYPSHLIAPTEVRARFTSNALGTVRVDGGVGPFVGELTLSIEYDGIESLRALKAAALSGDVAAGAAQIGKLPRNARFSASGRLGIGTEKYNLPVAGGAVRGEVSPDGVAWAGGTVGALMVPKGTFRQDMDVPGVGVQGQRGERAWSGAGSSTAGMAGVTGTPSIEAATKGDFGKVFPPFLYAQITHTTRNATGHVLGIRLSGHLRLAGEAEQQDARDRAGEALQHSRFRQGGDAENRPLIDPVVTNKWEDLQAGGRDENWRGGVEVFGTFDFLGGK